ncbi:glycosyltransferase [Pseudochelatococcus sp. B33]
MSADLRILVVSPVPSHPANQGNAARILAFGRELQLRGAVLDYLYYGMEGLTNDQRTAMSAFWHRFFFLASSPNKRPSYASRWGIDDWCPEELCNTVKDLVRTHRYDAVVVNYVWMSRVLVDLDIPCKVIDTHDLFSDRHKILEQNDLDPRWFFTSADEERKGFERADIVIGIQENESARIRAMQGSQVVTIGHVIAPHFLLGHHKEESFFLFGYLGSANPWNVRSVRELDAALAAETEDPLSWALAGTICRRDLHLKSGPYKMGLVDTLADFYRNVDCVINPMIGGTGLKIKTVEALSFGSPVIGTLDAFEGLPARHALHALATVEDMVEAMKDYRSIPALRTDLLRASRELYFHYMADVSRQYDHLAAMLKNVGPASRRSTARAAETVSLEPVREGRAPERLPAEWGRVADQNALKTRNRRVRSDPA